MNILISVIIPAYNCGKTIGKTLESILSQTKKPFEIIIINDGSVDDTSEVVSKYIKNNTNINIRVYNQDNQGPSQARNKGINFAKGEYILFCDADDYYSNNAIETMINNISNYDLLCFGLYTVSGKKKTYVSPTNFDFGKEFSNNSDILSNLSVFLESNAVNSLCNKLYKSRIIKENNLSFDKSLYLGEDLNFNLNYFTKCNAIRFIDFGLYHYLIDNSFLTKRYYNYETYYSMRMRSLILTEEVFNEHNLSIDNILPFFKLKIVYACMFNIFKNNQISKQTQYNYLGELLNKIEIIEIMKKSNFNTMQGKILYFGLSINNKKLSLKIIKLINLIKISLGKYVTRNSI